MNKKFDKLLGSLRESDSNLTSDQEAAITGAASPSASNVFSTKADLDAVSSSDYIQQYIKAVDLTIPAINANTRQIVTVSLGVLRCKTKALLMFYKSSANSSMITSGFALPFSDGLDCRAMPYTPSMDVLIQQCTVGKYTLIPVSGTNFCGFRSANSLLLYEDYTKARRFSFPSNNETDAANVIMPYAPPDLCYQSMGIGVLMGYYSSTNKGFLQLDKRVVLESAWLTQNGANTEVNFALKNLSGTANTALTVKIGVYE